ncbi:MAG: flippase-like domain-containing protein [Saprospirales bacterium]|nr:flippase-like domain-containing protein [Saprospirales bacterium]MBK8922474.1 flippase-like domain-containing protein [Saprospirales bacterium]
MNEPVIPQPVDAEGKRILHSLRLSRMLVPVLIGVAAVAYLFYRQFDPEAFRSIQWSATAFFWIGLAVLLLVLRHVFISFRLYTITRGYFSFRKCLQLIVLWEFSGALTPTSKGGPVVMLFVLTQEKLPAGRTAAAVFYAMICDSGFFVLTLPLLLLAYGPIMLYPGMDSYHDERLASGAFFMTYAVMLTYWLTLVFLLMIRPGYARIVLFWLASRPWLRRWSSKFQRLGQEFERAAGEIRMQDWRYHVKVVLSTLGSWTSKFILINALIIAIMPAIPLDGATQAFIYARLVAMFTIMTFSPTPGGAGLAEVALASFISDFVPQGLGLIVALLWRGMAFYGYLLLGAFIVPGWVAKQYRGRGRELQPNS